MRLLVGFLLLLAGPGMAQMTPTERYEDCVHVRRAAAEYQGWTSAVCHQDQSCPTFEDSFDPGAGVLHCLSEAYTVCEAQRRFDPSERDDCVAEMDALVVKKMADVDLPDLIERLNVLIAKVDGVEKAEHQRRKDWIAGRSHINCNRLNSDDYFGLNRAEICDRLQRNYIAAQGQILQHYVTRAEQDR